MNRTKQRWFPFLCQCKDCLEVFSIDGVVRGGKIVRLDEHRRIAQEDGNYYHRCGGNGHKKGKLSLYLAIKVAELHNG